MARDFLDSVFAGQPERLSVEQLAAVLGIKTFVALRGLEQRAIPAHKVNGAWVIYRDEVKQLMREELATRDR